MKNVSEWSRRRLESPFFCLEPEPTQFGQSRRRSRLRDLGLPELPKKWRLRNTASNIFNLEKEKDTSFLQYCGSGSAWIQNRMDPELLAGSGCIISKYTKLIPLSWIRIRIDP